jgi:hypothetical protein
MLKVVRWDDDTINHDPVHMHMMAVMMLSSMMSICRHLITREWLDGFS